MKKTIQLLVATQGGYSAAVVRVVLGAVLLAHGAQKLLGVFGGFGFTNTMAYFTDTVHLPWIVAFLVIVIEFFGALALVLGWFTRLWSALVVALMLGIIFTAHVQHGFFMNWYGSLPGEGYEYHVLAIGMALSLVASGGGRWSVDAALQAQNN